MCVVSMVSDHYDKQIPWIEPFAPYVPTETAPRNYPFVLPDPSGTMAELARLIDEFKRLMGAAKEIDEKTGQPDCVDPEKAKLQDRVAELEKLLSRAPEFVLVKGGNLEPGRYRVLDGKLYKIVESIPPALE